VETGAALLGKVPHVPNRSVTWMERWVLTVSKRGAPQLQAFSGAACFFMNQVPLGVQVSPN
jgi:hypothetical protein